MNKIIMFLLLGIFSCGAGAAADGAKALKMIKAKSEKTGPVCMRILSLASSDGDSREAAEALARLYERTSECGEFIQANPKLACDLAKKVGSNASDIIARCEESVSYSTNKP